MPSSKELNKLKTNTDQLFSIVVEDMSTLYDETISIKEASDAARNLIGFCRTMFREHQRQRSQAAHE